MQMCCPNCGAVLEMMARVRSKPTDEVPPEDADKSLNRYKLTPRMRQTAELLLSGMTNQQIAEALGVKTQVVKNYLSALYDKVGCGNRTEFVAMVLLGRRG